MQKFKYLARLGFYAALAGALGHEVISVLSMRYTTAKVLDWNLKGLMIVGFIVSLAALWAGGAAKVSFKEGRTCYLLLGIGMLASGCELAYLGYLTLRR
jgi:hypothetical protein